MVLLHEVLPWLDPGATAVVLVLTLVVFALVFAVSLILSSALETTTHRRETISVRSFSQQLHHSFLPLFAIIVACWAPWIIAHLPGAFDDDTVWQLLIWAHPEIWSDHHPWFTTLIYGLFMDVGRGLGSGSIALMLHSVAMTLVTAASFSFLLCYLKRFSPAKPLFYGCFVAICAVPLFASYGSSMMKDASFSWVWIIFCITFAECVRTKGAILFDKRWLACMVVSALLMCLTRKTGIYLVVLSLLVLLFAVGADTRRRIMAVGATTIVCMMAYSFILLPAFGITPTSSGEMFSLPLQQSARLINEYPDEVSDEQRATIDAVADFDTLANKYDIYRADNVKDTWHSSSTSDTFAYLHTWFSMGLRHPDVYAAATFINCNDLFLVGSPIQAKSDTNYEWTHELGLFFSTISLPDDGYDKTYESPSIIASADSITEGLVEFSALDGMRQTMNAYESALNDSVVGVLFSRSSLALWLPLFIFLFLLMSTTVSSRRSAIAIFPQLLFALTLLAGPLVLSRYCLPAAYVFPLMAMMPYVLGNRTSSSADEKTALTQ